MTLNTLNYKTEGALARVEINRPKAMNALNSEVLSELKSLVEHIESDSAVRAVVLTGVGEKAFVAGADIKEMVSYGKEEALQMSQYGQSVFNKIESCSKPFIAAVNGFALGGGFELALACDVIIASESAKFGLPEVSLGLIPGYGGTQRLARLIGVQKAKRLIFSAEMISAENAEQWGVVSQVVSTEELISVAIKLATKVSRQAPLAVQLAKKSLTQGIDVALGEGLKIEAEFFSQAFTTEDKNEGVTAFMEKRKPEFKGK